MADSVTWSDVLTSLLERRDLTVWESTWAMRQIMHGSVTEAQLAGFLIALRAKGETSLRTFSTSSAPVATAWGQ
jgi:anthranilate phosphoribosyltransferase